MFASLIVLIIIKPTNNATSCLSRSFHRLGAYPQIFVGPRKAGWCHHDRLHPATAASHKLFWNPNNSLGNVNICSWYLVVLAIGQNAGRLSGGSEWEKWPLQGETLLEIRLLLSLLLYNSIFEDVLPRCTRRRWETYQYSEDVLLCFTKSNMDMLWPIMNP